MAPLCAPRTKVLFLLLRSCKATSSEISLELLWRADRMTWRPMAPLETILITVEFENSTAPFLEVPVVTQVHLHPGQCQRLMWRGRSISTV